MGFDYKAPPKGKWSAKDLPDLSGKVAIVTGSNSGIGFYTAQELARVGATVYLACRTLSKATEAADQMKSDHSSGALKDGIKSKAPGEIKVLETPLNLAHFESVRQYAKAIEADTSRIDLLVNNAGIMAIPQKELTKDGNEMQFQSNHLGHFLLTALLMPLLNQSDAPRVVNVSSSASNFGEVKVDDLNFDKRPYNAWRVYGQSKLANLYFTHELNRRAKESGNKLVALSAHPGWTATNLQYTGPQAEGFMKKLTNFGNWMFAMPTPMGALPTLHACVAGPEYTDKFIGPDGMTGMSGWPDVSKEPKLASDANIAKALWDKSEEIVGEKFTL